MWHSVQQCCERTNSGSVHVSQRLNIAPGYTSRASRVFSLTPPTYEGDVHSSRRPVVSRCPSLTRRFVRQFRRVLGTLRSIVLVQCLYPVLYLHHSCPCAAHFAPSYRHVPPSISHGSNYATVPHRAKTESRRRRTAVCTYLQSELL